MQDPKKFNLGAEIEGSAGQALVDNTEKAKRTASKAGNAVSESAQSQGKEFVDNVSKGFSEAGDRLKGAVKDTVDDTKEFFDADGKCCLRASTSMGKVIQTCNSILYFRTHFRIRTEPERRMLTWFETKF